MVFISAANFLTAKLFINFIDIILLFTTFMLANKLLFLKLYSLNFSKIYFGTGLTSHRGENGHVAELPTFQIIYNPKYFLEFFSLFYLRFIKKKQFYAKFPVINALWERRKLATLILVYSNVLLINLLLYFGLFNSLFKLFRLKILLTLSSLSGCCFHT